MAPQIILYTFLIYTALLFAISWITSRKANNESFFVGNKASPWYVVAYGMIGASLSGVTFISVPGWVGSTQYSYMVMVLGYLVGYFIIAKVLIPLYYRLNLTSIYSYLGDRFGFWSYKTGASFFLISRLIGASFRMYLVIGVLQKFVFESMGIPFWATVALFILLIILYTFKGGIKTIVWTDTLQTTFMLLSVGIAVYLIGKEMNVGFTDLVDTVANSDYSKMFFFDNLDDKKFFIKPFLNGAFIAIVMTGLDQDMMQKNLSCKNTKDAQKNILTLSWALIPVNLLFLFLGAILFIYAQKNGITIPEKTDHLFPLIALKHLGTFAGIVFVIGLISAAYSSADSALTSLTTSFSVDFLGMNKDNNSEKKKIHLRYGVHLGISIVLLIIILIFNEIANEAVIASIFTAASFTYGPLLGLFAFGLFTKLKVRDVFVPIVAVLSPLICYVLMKNSEAWFGFKLGFELLIINGGLTFFGLYILSIGRNK